MSDERVRLPSALVEAPAAPPAARPGAGSRAAGRGGAKPKKPADPNDPEYEKQHPRGRGGRWIKKGDGMEGQEDQRVRQLQNRLASLGYAVGADGRFGPKTDEAVKRFQADHDLPTTGEIDPRTTDALRTAQPRAGATPAAGGAAGAAGPEAEASPPKAAGAYGAKYNDPAAVAKQNAELAGDSDLERGGTQNAAGQDVNSKGEVIEKGRTKAKAGAAASRRSGTGSKGTAAERRARAKAAKNGDTLTKGRGMGATADRQVRAMQELLDAIGGNLGEGGVDGRFGPDTQRALKRFQRRMGLNPDGIFGKQTRAALSRRAATLATKEATRPGSSLEEAASAANATTTGEVKRMTTKLEEAQAARRAATTGRELAAAFVAEQEARRELEEATSSASLPDLPNKPDKTNWVEKAGGLPSYIKRIAKHLHSEKAMPVGRAIAIAVNAAKKMCASGDTNLPGAQQVNAKSRAEACAAVADWNRKRGQGKLAEAVELMEGWDGSLLAAGLSLAGLAEAAERVTDDDATALEEALLEEAARRGGDRRVPLKRLPDGTFAPRGQGQVLERGAKVLVPHRSGHGVVPGRVERPGGEHYAATVKLEDGPDRGKTIQVQDRHSGQGARKYPGPVGDGSNPGKTARPERGRGQTPEQVAAADAIASDVRAQGRESRAAPKKASAAVRDARTGAVSAAGGRITATNSGVAGDARNQTPAQRDARARAMRGSSTASPPAGGSRERGGTESGRTGRSPAGRLRNFRTMSEDKLRQTIAAVTREGNDPDALEALRAERTRRDGPGGGAAPNADTDLMARIRGMENDRASRVARGGSGKDVTVPGSRSGTGAQAGAEAGETGRVTKASARATMDRLRQDDEVGGGGYFGEREGMPKAAREKADQAVVAAARELGMSDRQLMHWANSRDGRHAITGDEKDRSAADLKTRMANSMRRAAPGLARDLGPDWGETPAALRRPERGAAGREGGDAAPMLPGTDVKLKDASGRPSSVTIRSVDSRGNVTDTLGRKWTADQIAPGRPDAPKPSRYRVGQKVRSRNGGEIGEVVGFDDKEVRIQFGNRVTKMPASSASLTPLRDAEPTGGGATSSAPSGGAISRGQKVTVNGKEYTVTGKHTPTRWRLRDADGKQVTMADSKLRKVAGGDGTTPASGGGSAPATRGGATAGGDPKGKKVTIGGTEYTVTGKHTPTRWRLRDANGNQKTIAASKLDGLLQGGSGDGGAGPSGNGDGPSAPSGGSGAAGGGRDLSRTVDPSTGLTGREWAELEMARRSLRGARGPGAAQRAQATIDRIEGLGRDRLSGRPPADLASRKAPDQMTQAELDREVRELEPLLDAPGVRERYNRVAQEADQRRRYAPGGAALDPR